MADLPKLENNTAPIVALVALLPPEERDTARATLVKQDAESLRLLNHLISNEHAKRRMRAVGTTAPGSLLLIATFIAATRGPLFPWYYWGVFLGGVLPFALSPFTFFPTRLEKAALEALLRREDAHSIGPMLEGLHVNSASLRRKAKASLVRTLPQLTTEAFQGLTPTQRGCLYGTLNYIQRDSDLELRLAVLTALQRVGDQSCLGYVYLLATAEAATNAAQAVRTVAQNCLDHLLVRLDLGSLSTLPHVIDNTCAQVQSEGVDFQGYAACLLSLRQLLPQLTPGNYRSILSERHRDHLYMLLVLRPPFDGGKQHYGQVELMLEIVRTAERLGDTRAIKSLSAIARNSSTVAEKQIHTAVRRALPLLTALGEREKVSRTLLRGASAPEAQPGELLRAANPTASATAPDELLRSSMPEQERVTFKANLPSGENKVVLLQRTDDPGR